MNSIIKKIVAIGDSVVYGRIDPLRGGWVSRLRKWFELQRPAENAVFNLGIGGETTTKLLRRFRIECKARKPDLILLSVGVNDCRHVDSSDAPLETSPERFGNNITSLLTASKQLAKVVVFIGMVPVDESRTTPIRNLFHFVNDQRIFDNLTREICERYNVHYVDNFTRWLSNDQYVMLLEDGLHPNSLGHQDLFKYIREFLTSTHIV